MIARFLAFHEYHNHTHFPTVPRFRRNTFGRRAFSVGGLMAWNSLAYLTVFGTHHTAPAVSGVI